MAYTVFAADAVSGAPEYAGQDIRQALGVALGGATSTRPLGARSGVRPGTPTNTVTATSTTWTCKPVAGVIDKHPDAATGPYLWASDANVTGSVTAADASNPRKDIVYVQVSDPSTSDGSTTPGIVIAYTAGTPAASPSAPTTPSRAFVLAEINVPASGGGSPSVTWVAPYAVAAGGVIPVRNTTERAAAGTGATTENPVVVYRKDAAAGSRLEYTDDGSTWYALTPAQTPGTGTRGSDATTGPGTWGAAATVSSYPLVQGGWYLVTATGTASIGGAASTIRHRVRAVDIAASSEWVITAGTVGDRYPLAGHLLFQASATTSKDILHEVYTAAPATGVVAYTGHTVSIVRVA